MQSKTLVFLPFIILVVSLFIFLLPLPPAAVSKGGGFGFFSMNMLSPILGGKLIELHASIKPGQYEGFNYLGLGVIIAFLIVIFSQRVQCLQAFKSHRPFFTLMIIYAIYALSKQMYVGEKWLLTIHYPAFFSYLFAQFRASGRFFWPVAYSIIIFSSYRLYCKLGRRSFFMLMMVLLLTQLIDISDYYVKLRQIRDVHPQAMMNYAAFDRVLSGGVTNLYFFPKYGCGINDDILPVMKYIAQRHLKLNTGYIAHHDPASCDIRLEITQSLPDKSAYLFLKSQYSDIKQIRNFMGDGKNVTCQAVDFAYVCRFSDFS